MYKELLSQANELDKKIECERNILKGLNKLETKNCLYITNYNDGSTEIPQELKSAIFALLKNHHQTQLTKLEEEFAEL